MIKTIALVIDKATMVEVIRCRYCLPKVSL
jgi:hypothetical protein